MISSKYDQFARLSTHLLCLDGDARGLRRGRAQRGQLARQQRVHPRHADALAAQTCTIQSTTK